MITIQDIDKELDIMTMDYNRQERRWNLPDEMIPIRKANIRALKHQKVMILEGLLLTGGSPILKKMLSPIMLRRARIDANLDGTSFIFEIAAVEYQPKHLRGFWSCPACVVENKGFEAKQKFEDDLSIYNRQIEWCPKFIPELASRGPEYYTDLIRKNNPDLPICYAGLFHTELQISETEMKLVKQCDTCGFSTVETKQLQKEMLDNYEIGMDSAIGKEELFVTARCNQMVTVTEGDVVSQKQCGEIIFSELESICIDPHTQRLYQQYDDLMDKHHRERH